MVGRFVEEEQVGLFQQQAAKGDAAALTARERADGQIRRRAAERVQRDFDAAVEVPAVLRVDEFLELGLLGEEGVHLGVVHRLGEFVRDGVEAGKSRAQVGEGLRDVFAYRLGRVEMRLLRQVADAGTLGGPGLAAIFLLNAGDDLEKRGFAGAVDAEHADFNAGQEGKRDALKNLTPARIGFGEVLHDINVLISGHRSCPLKRLGWV